MPFEKVDTQVDFPAQERAILELWKRTQAFEKLRAKNRNGPRWSFLDGPITANNPMGVHHAWGRTYKDVFQRYHAMNGYHMRYQNGFDCQGLWVEVEVEKELKLRSKRDIENLVPGDPFASIDRFVQLCKDRVNKFARVQTEQSIRLGYWMDWDRNEDWLKPPGQRRSYYTMSDENNYTIWHFLKKCHQRGLVYRGYDAMPWCPRCSVGLSQMEMNEGYRLVAHRAVFVRFPLRGRPNENLLVWTTTPWTLSSNVGAAVNPELTYLKVVHKDQLFYLGKAAFKAPRLEEAFKRKEWVDGVPKLKTLEQIFKEKGGYEEAGEVRGAEMVGWAYDGPFDELLAGQHSFGYPDEVARIVRKQKWAPEKSARDLHRVVAWKDVGEAEGTGIVHIAPGCGKEDFQLGKEQGLPPVAPLDDYGQFVGGFCGLEGRSAVDPATADWVITDLQHKGMLFASERYPHNYPHCWRCKTELLFRLVDEWFINMSWRDEIIRVTDQVEFLPESINGRAKERDWLKNMGDWMISKKRFWGLALPIWVEEQTGDFEVIGGYQELKERAVEGWQEFEGHTPHRPWIDKVKIRNPKTGNLMTRVPDVGNPWLDAGIVPYSTMGYNTNRAEWQKWFPADFITESFPGQFRNWFYAILAMSTMMENQAPTRVLLGHAQVRDQNGKEMHKSAGNAIPFEGAADTGYAIAVRALKPNETFEAASKKEPLPTCATGFVPGEIADEKGKKVPALLATYPPMDADLIRWMYCRHNPAANINFGPAPAEEVRSKFTMKLWNVYAFFCNYARLDGFDPTVPPLPVSQRTDLDRWILSDLQHLVRAARTQIDRYNLMPFCLEVEAFVDDKLSNWYVRRNRRRFWKSEKGADKLAAYQTLYTVLLRLTKLLAPMMPFVTEAMYQNLAAGADRKESVHLCDYPVVDEGLIDPSLDDMDTLLDLVSLGSAARNSVKIKVRQPLAELKVQPGNDSVRRAVERFGDLICDELNVKKVTLHDPANGALLRQEVKGNPKTLGPKFGARLREVQTALASADPSWVAEQVQKGGTFTLPCPDGAVELEPADVMIQLTAPEGWAGAVDHDTQVQLDVRITEDLALAGMAREVVRHIQELRKKADLEMEDRIILYLVTDAARLRKALETHRDYIASETLTTEWATQPLGAKGHQADVKVDGQALTIEVGKDGLDRSTGRSSA
jgi:isoleucyl-tRNA synthetase